MEGNNREGTGDFGEQPDRHGEQPPDETGQGSFEAAAGADGSANVNPEALADDSGIIRPTVSGKSALDATPKAYHVPLAVEVPYVERMTPEHVASAYILSRMTRHTVETLWPDGYTDTDDDPPAPELDMTTDLSIEPFTVVPVDVADSAQAAARLRIGMGRKYRQNHSAICYALGDVADKPPRKDSNFMYGWGMQTIYTDGRGAATFAMDACQLLEVDIRTPEGQRTQYRYRFDKEDGVTVLRRELTQPDDFLLDNTGKLPTAALQNELQAKRMQERETKNLLEEITEECDPLVGVEEVAHIESLLNASELRVRYHGGRADLEIHRRRALTVHAPDPIQSAVAGAALRSYANFNAAQLMHGVRPTTYNFGRRETTVRATFNPLSGEAASLGAKTVVRMFGKEASLFAQKSLPDGMYEYTYETELSSPSHDTHKVITTLSVSIRDSEGTVVHDEYYVHDKADLYDVYHMHAIMLRPR